ncbi:acetolactate synthase [Penicillium frequentans]|uniref:Acetolactate synthase n=1 Tax=Penicillium frequentans TaxID=3151616 RepID=A0AAD6D425_9EURO|nr:acetolactate synthase [Penicillium glabrum]
MDRQALVGLSGGETLRELLAYHNVKHIFGYPGGAALPLFDGIYETSSFKFIHSRHEQGAGHMAEGYARASGKPGVVMVTSGPGTSNLATPLLNALMDGTPLVAICGQVNTAVQGTGAFQEIDAMALARPCTKWSACVQNISDLPAVVDAAFDHAMGKRAGPVLIAIPKDVGSATFDKIALSKSAWPDREDHGSSDASSPGSHSPTLSSSTVDLNEKIDRISDLINRSQRPVICAGNGVIASERGCELLADIARKAQIPVATTLLGLGCFDEAHTLSVGMMGTYGCPSANHAIQNADVVIVLGARLDERAVGDPSGFAPQARKSALDGKGGILQFEIDLEIVGKVVKPTEVIHGDLSETLPIILLGLVQQGRERWLDQIQIWKKEDSLHFPVHRENSVALPQQVILEIGRQTSLVKNPTFITTGVGQHQMWAAKYYQWRYPRSLATSGSLGTMGFGLPAAIGAQIALPDHIVIDVDGDASFCMTMEELLTASQYNTPIKVIILNNEKEGMITQLQQADYGGRVCHDRPRNPQFVDLTQSMGCQGRRCFDLFDLRESIEWLLQCEGPALLEVKIADTNMVPTVAGGKPLDVMKME